ncbi:multicopper oxidase domain-containing protein [Streptomyces sp. CWNU-1]|uniref:Multicopper oxidase domain-containing protein n=2 Tax=Streptomyces albipurpureus TaxID=2897419 RepID=A0ABT0UQE1_9ACTN|nr:O-aminophenol oxidase PhsA [Streptomyces sp. CWNU-1]MCM2390320.1 multicopper oxidase domain-containing protein [Streptomyces sp. CWNU-1]
MPVPQVLRPDEPDVRREIEIALRPTWVRMHSQLPPTLMWGYNGTVPGPTVEVRRGQRIRIAWTNRIPRGSEYPVTAVEVGRARPDDILPHNRPGREGVEPNKDVAALPAWSVTHLHGAQTGGGNDGWADNAVGFGDAQLAEYPNDHQAVQWWYHDHAMNITRWNVYAGLVGTYLVRDDEEDALGLPSGERELPLILADRNLDTDSDGRLNGRLLHKTSILVPKHPETGKPVTLPFVGPYSTVNGVIWPHLDVDAGWYRFRLVNASNARIYNLVLVDEDDNPVPGVMHQIGSDGGLLPRPVPLDFIDGAPLIAAPAERFDLLIDFRKLAGRKVRLINKGRNKPLGEPDLVDSIPYPQVMEFRVDKCDTPERFALPSVVSGSFRRFDHDHVDHGHRLIVLTPPSTVGGGGHPEIWEMAELKGLQAAAIDKPTAGIVQVQGSDGRLRTYRRTSRTFNDGLGFTIGEGSYEQWSFLNLGFPVHPMHIHLADFQVLAREAYDVTGFDPALGGTRRPVTVDPNREIPVPPNEQGWKDVFRVTAAELVKVMGHFDGAYGRFMYHCHLLEHEDMGMMRPFVVMPPEALKFDHGTGHGGHHAWTP